MKSKLIILLAICHLTPFFLFAQNYKATAKMDSTNYLIGDYVNIYLQITAPKQSPIYIPQLNQEIFQKSEIPYDWVKNSKIDTLPSGNQLIYKQTITVIAFDSGQYIFPSIPILDLDSHVLAQTDPILFNITTIPVDTNDVIKDIKPIEKIPFTFHELWLFIKEHSLLIIGIIIVIVIIIYLIIKYNKHNKNKKPKVYHRVKPKVKPHIRALKELEQLRKRKLWEQGQVKQYYSELTDIVREYIDGRWEINAKEMVSKDILEDLSGKEIDAELIDLLKNTFSTADLVKFAKWDPLPDDHNSAFKNCKVFVQRTAEVPEIPSSNPTNNNDTQNKTFNQK